MAAFNLRVESRFLAGGVGFQVPALVFDSACDFKCASVFGSLENQVLVKVTQTKFIFCFVTRSPRHPDAKCDRVGVRHVVRQNSNTVIENCFLYNLFHS